MKRKRLQTPHDRFFKAMFGKTAVVSSFVRWKPGFTGLILARDAINGAKRGIKQGTEKVVFYAGLSTERIAYLQKQSKKNSGEINM
jgi:hypothetical protein